MIYICINKGKIKSLTQNKAYEGQAKRHFMWYKLNKWFELNLGWFLK